VLSTALNRLVDRGCAEYSHLCGDCLGASEAEGRLLRATREPVPASHADKDG
jgi:hypothetical protein